MRFSTAPLPARDQSAAWSDWFHPIFDVWPQEQPGFIAEYAVWKLGAVSVTWASAPAARTVRSPSHLRHGPIDHWVVTFSKQGPTTLSTKGGHLDVRAGVPFVWSMGHASESTRTMADRLQLYLPRDAFPEIGDSLDHATGSALDTPSGRLLADYMLLLQRNLADLAPEDAARFPQAIGAMLAACLEPSADRLVEAAPQIDLTLMERVRRSIRRNLRSPSLGPDTLCREAAMSRSKLYRVLESEGGVASYIQRCRLSESFKLLCDASNTAVVGTIAESLCFADASSFSRAFRREFGISPTDVRKAAVAGLAPVAPLRRPTESDARNFGQCLRA